MKLTVSQIRKLLPIIPLFPITTFLSRLLEKWTSLARLLFQYFCMKLNLVGARDIEIMENGNHILVLNQDTALGAKGNLVQLPKDTVIYNFVLLHGCWEVEESKFLANLLDSRKSQSSMGALLDIGANTGLVSIQSSNLGISEFELLMIEPLTQHLEAIHFNLKLMNRSRNYKIFPGALSEKGGESIIYTESTNFGNTSLLESMVPDKLKIKNKINLIEIQQFCEKELHFVDQIVIKCDTQGFDAHILSRLTDEVWGKVIGGLLEITPIGNKTCSDIENLVKILGRFPKISFCPKLSTEISCEEVLAYWKTDSMVPRNLYFSLA